MNSVAVAHDLIPVDLFKVLYYKKFLPLEKINQFLSNFPDKEQFEAAQNLIAIFDLNLTDTILEKIIDKENKIEFMRLCNLKYDDPKILDFLTDEFVDSENIIKETLERSLLSTMQSLKE